MILDVGCGDKPKGDVNVDLYPHASRQRSVTTHALNTKCIPNFVVADACHLPFRSEVFEQVVTHHCIEHVQNPKAMFMELLRVAKHHITIKTPHHLGDTKKNKLHLQHFNKAWFKKLLHDLDLTGNVDYSEWRVFPHRFIPLARLPCEILVEVWKA